MADNILSKLHAKLSVTESNRQLCEQLKDSDKGKIASIDSQIDGCFQRQTEQKELELSFSSQLKTIEVDLKRCKKEFKEMEKMYEEDKSNPTLATCYKMAKGAMEAAQLRFDQAEDYFKQIEKQSKETASSIADMQHVKNDIMEDLQVTEEEMNEALQLIDNINEEIKERENEVTQNAKEYPKNAAGACQHGIDVIFGLNKEASPEYEKVKAEKKAENERKELERIRKFDNFLGSIGDGIRNIGSGIGHGDDDSSGNTGAPWWSGARGYKLP